MVITAVHSFSAIGATLIDAVAQGECTSSGGCTSATSLSRSFAGNSGGETYRDWFTFSVLPNLAVSSATLSIYNSANNLVNNYPNQVFSLYAPTGFSYGGLVGNGTPLGSVTALTADTGTNHYVDIALNANGLAYINSNLGKAITFGGSSSAGSAQFFGYAFTAGKPAVLSLHSVALVPEPETYALLLAGLSLIGATVKRRKAMRT
ncbi:MAG: PEP-CTERM sorting domain-containing protein [Rhodoferax sp.]|nr:PEP-CTERM sorting domain-containing protein [Rhodoferax sp.]